MPDIVTSKIWVDGEKGVTASKMNQIISGAVIQSDFYAAKAASSTLDPTDQLLELKSTGSYARITGQQLSDSVAGSPSITAMRLRSFNAVGNPTFEVDQRNVGTVLGNPANGTFPFDRWQFQKAGTMTVNIGQQNASVLIPGTSFAITSKQVVISLTGQQSTLGASDFLGLTQFIEGPRFRQLSKDVHSLSLLVYSTVAPLNFSVSIRDNPATKSLVKLCTVSSASTWTLIPLSNLPVFPSGNFTTAPGSNAYQLMICLAAGASNIAAAADTWQNGNFQGAPGMDNWASKPVNTNIYFAFVQHEPGSQCTTPIDCPFTQNQDDCLRYYTKTYDYATAIGTVTTNGVVPAWSTSTGTGVNVPVQFKRRMAKVPTVTIYNQASGAANSLQFGGAAQTVSSVNWIGEHGFGNMTLAASATGPASGQCHYIADTGW